MKLLGSAENEITRQKRWKCAASWITKVVLVHCNIVNNDYQQDSRV